MNVRRFDIILKLLNENKNIKVQELMEKLNVSEATIRRDLNTLEKKEMICTLSSTQFNYQHFFL